jgi:hypothetical protein
MSRALHTDNRISTTSFNSRDAATLAAAATFQGVGEDVSEYGRVGVSITSTNATDGTLYMEVSHDNSTWASIPRTIANSSIAEPHMWNIVEKYFRIKYVNGTTEATALSIQVQYSTNANILLGHQLDQTLIDETEAIIARSVLVGKTEAGDYINVPVTGTGLLKTNSPNTVFGESLTAELTPTIQISDTYDVDPTLREDLETFSATGGSADSLNNMFRCQSGTSVGGYGVIRSKNTVRYRPGEGAIARITGTFTTGIASSLQFAGLFSLTETLAFGYDGENFSIIHEYNGEAEVQTVQVTATPSGTENATITLDGDAAVISITNSTVQTNAAELKVGLVGDATLAGKWRFEQIDDTVICISRSVGDKTGTMSASAATATFTVTEVEAGVAKSNNNVVQANWNHAPFTGFDPTKLNIYQLEYGYLGSANLIFKIYNPTTGDFDQVHAIQWANSNTTPNFGNPDMKVGWTAASLGSSGTNLTVTGGSAMGGIEGKETIQEASRSTFTQTASIGTTLTNVLTLQNRIVYGKRFNLGNVIPISVSIDNDHNKGIIVELVINATIAGTQNYQYFEENNSIVAIDTAGTTVTGGTVIDSFTVGAGASSSIDVEKLRVLLLPEDILTIAVRTVSGTATNTTGSITWLEEK